MSKTIMRAVLAAIMLLALAAGTTSANRSITSTETLITLLAPAFSLEAFGSRIVCEVSLSLSLNTRAYTKVVRSGIGTIEARVVNPERCSGGTLRFLTGPFTTSYVTSLAHYQE